MLPCAVICCVVSISASSQVLEPKDGKVIYKDWDAMGSDISKLETFDDDEQPLPQNVSYGGRAAAGWHLRGSCLSLVSRPVTMHKTDLLGRLANECCVSIAYGAEIVLFRGLT